MSIRILIQFLTHYKYVAIFPIAVAEGPIISIISGFLVSRGILSLLGAFLVVFLGDGISDTAFYYIGRGGKKYIHKFRFLGITDERVAKIEDRYERSPWKTMIIAKVSYGLGSVFMVAGGVSRMSLKRFLWFMGVLNAVRSLLLIAIGYYFGRLAIRYSSRYFGYYTLAVVILVPLIYFIVKIFRSKKIQMSSKLTVK